MSERKEIRDSEYGWWYNRMVGKANSFSQLRRTRPFTVESSLSHTSVKHKISKNTKKKVKLKNRQWIRNTNQLNYKRI